MHIMVFIPCALW